MVEIAIQIKIPSIPLRPGGVRVAAIFRSCWIPDVFEKAPNLVKLGHICPPIPTWGLDTKLPCPDCPGCCPLACLSEFCYVKGSFGQKTNWTQSQLAMKTQFDDLTHPVQFPRGVPSKSKSTAVSPLCALLQIFCSSINILLVYTLRLCIIFTATDKK